MGSAYQSTDEDHLLDSESEESSDYDSEDEEEQESDEFAQSASDIGRVTNMFGGAIAELNSPLTSKIRSKSALGAESPSVVQNATMGTL